jgi:hypothetical protein
VTLLRDANGQALAYVYFEDGARSASGAKLLTRDEARRNAANIAKLPELLRRAPACALFDRCPSSCSSHSAISTLDASGFKLTRVRLLLAKPTKYQAET